MPVINLDPSLDNRTVVLWNNLGALNSTTVTAGGSISGHPVENVIDPATYNSWQAGSGVGARVQFSFNQPRVVRAIGIAAHTIGSTGAIMSIHYSSDNISFPTIYSTTPATNEDMLVILPSAMNYQYWAVNFTGGAPSVGVIFAGGNLTTFPCTPIDSYTPVHHSRQYTKQFNRSIQGQFLGNRVMGRGGTMSVQFPHLARDWVDGPLTGFENHYNRGGTFFYAGWPGGKPQDMAYAWPASEDSIIDVEYVNADKLATVSFDMQFYNPT